MKAKEAIKHLDISNYDDLLAGFAGCPRTYFPDAKNICTQPGRSDMENCRECWEQDVEIPKNRPAPDPDVGSTVLTIEDLTCAFYNVISTAVEEYGGNTDRLYTYTKGVCDLVDAVAEMITGEDPE